MHTRISYPKNKKCHHVHSFRNYRSSQECTDDVGLAISHTQGAETVASMVVFEGGKPGPLGSMRVSV